MHRLKPLQLRPATGAERSRGRKSIRTRLRSTAGPQGKQSPVQLAFAQLGFKIVFTTSGQGSKINSSAKFV
eukprot:5669414-Alexandrium_andersonii.AAC.1